jgi:hypothetical protein
MAVGDEAQRSLVWEASGEQIEDAAAGVGDGAWGEPGEGCGLAALCWGTSSATAVGCGIDGVDEPGFLAGGGGESEGFFLSCGEGFEVVEDDGLVEVGEVLEGEGLEEECMSSESGGESGDGGGSAAEGTSDLAVSGSGLEEGGDGAEELGALEVVGGGEGLEGGGAVAGWAPEPWDDPAVALSGVGAGWSEGGRKVGLGGVRGALGPGAEGWPEGVVG